MVWVEKHGFLAVHRNEFRKEDAKETKMEGKTRLQACTMHDVRVHLVEGFPNTSMYKLAQFGIWEIGSRVQCPESHPWVLESGIVFQRMGWGAAANRRRRCGWRAKLSDKDHFLAPAEGEQNKRKGGKMLLSRALGIEPTIPAELLDKLPTGSRRAPRTTSEYSWSAVSRYEREGDAKEGKEGRKRGEKLYTSRIRRTLGIEPSIPADLQRSLCTDSRRAPCTTSEYYEFDVSQYERVCEKWVGLKLAEIGNTAYGVVDEEVL
ncbi:hypothetical protein C8R43DRAFT_941155 [Mycena crocata]|nr:hypothetical protein C8R43DRAFT_941155 [Mycena crocata]